MSAAAPSPNPTNLLLLAVIGIGAYYMMSRRAYAQPVYAGQQQQRNNNAAALLAAGVGALGKLFGGGGSSGSSTPLLGTWDGRSQTPWDVTPQGSDGPRYNNPSAYVADDGLAYNPSNYAPWDSMQLPYGTM